MVTIHTHAKGQNQRSFGSEVRMETDGRTNRRTEATALPPVVTRSVKMDVENYYSFSPLGKLAGRAIFLF